MAKELTAKILQQYGVTADDIAPVQKGYRNESYAVRTADNRVLNLIIYKREPEIVDKIKNANYVADFLAKQGMPVRRTADPRITRLTRPSSDTINTAKYAALYHYLPGATIPWDAYTMRHIKLLGQMMSDMHAQLIDLPRANLPNVDDECLALLDRMQTYFDDKGVQDALTRKLDLAVHDIHRFRSVIMNAARLPGQALHMDFVRGNILFDGEGESLHVSGILDFEKAAWGSPAFDIARTLAFLIVDCKYKEQTKVRKYFVHSGYNKRGGSTFTPSDTFEQLVDFFLLHDFYKFLRHNPFEDLEQNEHFLRTKDFLLKRNILSKSKVLQ